MVQNIITIMADEPAIKALTYSLDKFGLSNICEVEQHDNMDIILQCCTNKKVFKAPSRIGEIIDQIRIYKHKLLEQKALNFSIGNGRINTSLGVFYLDNGEDITLTEKEVEILTYLYENKGKVVTREELLERVWNYAKDVETHTLETHIYRLRQKIEIDPTSPKILKTKENGYSV